MENIPSSLLCDGNISCQLYGRNALLVAGDKVHGDKPFHQRNLGVLKDSAHKDGKVRPAVVAVESSIGSRSAVVLSAERANNVVLLPSGITDCLPALLFGVIVGGKFVNAVESVYLNHTSNFISVFYYLY